MAMGPWVLAFTGVLVLMADHQARSTPLQSQYIWTPDNTHDSVAMDDLVPRPVVLNVVDLEATFILDEEGKPTLVSGCTGEERRMLKMVKLPRPYSESGKSYAFFSTDENGTLYFLCMRQNRRLKLFPVPSLEKYKNRMKSKRNQFTNGTVFDIVSKGACDALTVDPHRCNFKIQSVPHGHPLHFVGSKALKTLRSQQLKVMKTCGEKLNKVCHTSAHPYTQVETAGANGSVFNIFTKSENWWMHERDAYFECPRRPFNVSRCEEICSKPSAISCEGRQLQASYEIEVLKKKHI